MRQCKNPAKQNVPGAHSGAQFRVSWRVVIEHVSEQVEGGKISKEIGWPVLTLESDMSVFQSALSLAGFVTLKRCVHLLHFFC